MRHHFIESAASVGTAAGTLLLFTAAIWGDRIRDMFLGPRLGLSLVDAMGDLNERGSGIKVYYYNLRVSNRRARSVATSVRILLQRYSRRGPSGAYIPEPIVYPLPLYWTPAEWNEDSRTVFNVSTCDFGFLDDGGTEFRPALRVCPNNFRGFVAANQSVRYEVIASGPNVYFSQPIVLQVSWDGTWTSNREDMRRHLEIRQVPEL